MRESIRFHQVPISMIEQAGFKWFVPWKLAHVRRLARPVPYDHRPGAVIWVNLSGEVERAIRAG
jgi:hypothetical protein